MLMLHEETEQYAFNMPLRCTQLELLGSQKWLILYTFCEDSNVLLCMMYLHYV